MVDGKNIFPASRRNFYALISLACICLVCVAFSMAGTNDFDNARREVLLRRIGHEVLLQSGDSSSRVLPIKKIGGNTYQLSFEKPFSFQPHSLVHTMQRLLAKDPLATDYVVNVVKAADAGITYGFAISHNKKDDIITCIGRKQPLAFYTINIQFRPAGIFTARNGLLLGGLTILAILGFIFSRSAKPEEAIPEPDFEPTDLFSIGSMSFNPELGQLMMNGKTIDLTRTETRILQIFVQYPNEPIDRSRLQKEIWEDEGVIVGRSLDVFISKLRKKLELDPKVRIVAIRGKGYKLETGT